MKRKLSFFALILILILSACGLTSGDDDDKETQAPTSAAAVNETRPTIEMNTPLSGSEVVVNTEVLVYSIARDPAGVTRVELMADGTLVNTVTSPNPNGQTELASLQSWRPTATGQVTLEVVAYRGETASDPAAASITVVAEQTQVRTPIATPTVLVPVQTTDTSCRVRVNIDQLNVYAQPSSVAQIVQSISIGEVIPLLGRTAGNEWWEINVRGQRGWIDAGYT
ncbi:MAG: SH3 domain-containing protein, partial [Anaerolineae bacterium]|nr:SH3 domain-containing protein [Anaerolineae bacterium]